MPYKAKTRKEFIESLKNIKIDPQPEEKFVQNFVPVGLPNLYNLFCNLKDINIDSNLFDKLSFIVSNNYPEKVSSLLHNPITNNEITELLEVMKETYYNIINNGNPDKIPESEENNLKIILNRCYPEISLDFIKKPVEQERLFNQTNLIKNAVFKGVDNYTRHSDVDGVNDLNAVSTSFYLVYRELYPDFSIFISNRTKGKQSYIDNNSKELLKRIREVSPTDQSERY